MWALLIKSRGGVRGSHFFIWPSRVCVAEQGILVLKDLTLKLGVQFHYKRLQQGLFLDRIP